jgi:gliding motility-associated-like protein
MTVIIVIFFNLYLNIGTPMKKNYAFLLSLLFFVSQFAIAQSRCKIILDNPLYKIVAFDTVYKLPQFVNYREQNRPNAENIPNLLNTLFKLSDFNSWNLVRSETDDLGFKHLFYQQLYRKVPVNGAVVSVHCRQNKIESISGLALTATGTVEPVLSKEEAIKTALSAYPAAQYKWQSTYEELELKEIKNDPNATWYPNPVLSFVNPNHDLMNPDLKLSYKLEVYADEPLFAYRLFIDAESGEIIAKEDLIHHINKQGKAVTRYSDTQQIMTDSFALNSYRLRETGRGNGIETFNMKKGTSYGAAVDFVDTNNFWDTTNVNQDDIATDAHWGAEWTYDYFQYFFGRNSYDNKGAKIRSYVHYSNNYNNAFWNGSVMTYGDGNGTVFTPLTSIDVCGHEVAHAVTTNTAALVYSYESGALNESFSDIFGNSIEHFAKPNDFNWKLGEDITPNGQGIRNMAIPNLKGQPDTYKGTYWYTGAGDNGGVHTNSGVQNYWYYLLCEGGKGKNDKADSFFVDSIGMLKAQQIAYRNLSVYLSSGSKYADARFYSIQAAVDLFGNCSPEVIATTNAWHAVGVGARYDSGNIEANFLADTFFCRAPATLNFINTSINTNKYAWKFGDGGASTATNPIHTYNQYGTYDVELIATGCFANKIDTLIRKAYIVIDSTRDICKGTTMPYGTWTTRSVCTGFIYDNGGEGDYKDLIRDTLTIAPLNADSIVLTFLDFDYEDKFDSLFIFDGPTPAFPKIGGYTGKTLPKAGLPIKSSGGSLTLIHFSDQLEHGRGFKASITAYRPKLSLSAMPDSLVCYNQSIKIVSHPRGGYIDDYYYRWNQVFNSDSILQIALQRDSSFEIELIDACTNLRDTAYVNITVRKPLKLVVSKDTTICLGTTAQLKGFASNGLSSGYKFTWNGLVGASTFNTTPFKDSIYTVVLLDGCSGANDTALIKVNVLQPLKLIKSKDTLICFGTNANINVSGAGGNGMYTFNWSDGLGTGASKSVSPLLSKKYSITLSDGCTVSGTSDSIEVLVRDALKISLSNDSTLCQGQTLLLSPNVQGGDTLNRIVTWNNSIIGNSLPVISSVDTIIYVQVNDKCSPISRDTINITLLAPLKVTLPADDTLCVGQSRIIVANAIGGKIANVQYEWIGLGLGKSILANPVVTTSYSVVVSDGCTIRNDTATINFAVRSPLNVTANPDITICAGDTTYLSASASGGLESNFTFDWNNGAGSGNNLSAAPLNTTWYEVTLNDGCSNYDLDSVLVTVKPAPQVDFYIDASPACANRVVYFKNLTTPSTLDSYEWDLGDGRKATSRETLAQFNNEGYYKVSLKVTNDLGCTKIKSIDSIIEIVAMPNPSFSMNAKIISFDKPELILNNTTTKAVSYLWDFGDLNASVSMSPTHLYSDTGHYTVSLTATNRLGCDSTIAQQIWVKPMYRIHFPNAFTPTDQNSNNDVFLPVTTGVAEFDMIIFNRWGEILFKSTQAQNGWNGKDKDGNFHLPGNYLYYINIIDVEGVRYEYSGNVLLLR